MRAVILAGGQGMRLRPYTTVLPKPLLPVGDRPVLELIVHQLARAGFTQLDLLVGHLGHLIRAYLQEGTDIPADVEVRYHWEDEPLGTAGALHQIAEPSESFVVMNGDTLTTLDYRKLMRFHADSGAALTIATHRKDVAIDLGVIESEDGLLARYIEKPTLHYMVSMGVYVYEPRVLNHIPHRRFDFPQVAEALLDSDERVSIYPFDGIWFDIGTPAAHERATAEVQANPDLFEV
jgi:NDP-mannose synthase